MNHVSFFSEKASRTGMALATLAHDFAEVAEVIGVVGEAEEEAPDSVEFANTLMREGDIQVRLIRPCVEHSFAHASTFFQALTNLRDTLDSLPIDLVARATFDRQAARQHQSQRHSLL